ncbi:imidazolonepropionase-like domain-containing protein [Streptomyces sp. NPDC091268]|uniref:imidazolonepropionase-like domain-containing protein n=1 Tax=Streptomyces sp. NPDC091268 TaxID=3365979 RepID=UPI003824A3A7
MLTLHTADLLVAGPGRAPLEAGAVLVEGDRIARVGPYGELAAGHPHARVRRWPGVLTPGLLVRGADALLERTYHPDDLDEPADPADPADPDGMTEARWGNSARRGTQKLLARGVVAVAGRFTVAAVRTAVVRSGLAVQAPVSYEGAASLDPFAGRERAEEAFHGVLEPGAAARFAVFAVAGPQELLERGATSCVATVIGGRLLHRRR